MKTLQVIWYCWTDGQSTRGHIIWVQEYIYISMEVRDVIIKENEETKNGQAL